MQILCECAAKREPLSKFNKLILPILSKMYASEDAAKEMIVLAKSFNKLLMQDKVDEKVLPFIFARNNNLGYSDTEFDSIPKKFLTPKALRMWRNQEIKFSQKLGN